MEYAILMGTVILAFLLVLAAQHRQWTRKLNRQLLREFNLLEKDKKRIAADLHDEIAPYLMITGIHISKVKGATDKEFEHLQQSASTISDTIVRLGEIVRDLHPYVLEKMGLKAALQDLTYRYYNAAGFKIEFDYRVLTRLTPTQSLHIYRLVMEIIHNTLKHAGATKLELSFEEKAKTLVIRARDNGIGMAEETMTGLGSISIRDRVDILGGNLQLESNLTMGTFYEFQIPLTSVYAKNNQSHYRR